MKKLLLFGIPALVVGLLYGLHTTAAPIFQQYQGGTATGSTFTQGSLITQGSSSYSGLVPGSNGTVLSVVGGTPTYVATSTLGIVGGSSSTTTITSNILSNGPAFTFATSSVTGLNFNISGSGSTLTFAPALQSGYNIPLTASTTNWNNLYNTSIGGLPGQFLGNTSAGTLAWLTPVYTTVCSSGCAYTATGTNDQVGINAAITAVSAAGGGTIYIKAGTYTESGTINIATATNVTLLCDGGATIFPKTAFDGIKIINSRNITIENCNFDGTNMSHSAFNADVNIRVSDLSNNVRIVGNSFANMYGFGIFNDSHLAGSTSNITILNNFMNCQGLQDCIGGGTHDNTGTNVTQDVSIIGNTIIQNTFGGGVVNSNMDVNCVDMVMVLRQNIQNNNCKGMIVYGNERLPNTYSQISNNIVEAPAGPLVVSGDIVIETGCLSCSVTSNATNTPLGLSVIGNTIKSGGIDIIGDGTNPTQVEITGNWIQTSTSTAQTFRSAQHGIELSSVVNSSVRDNTIISYTTGASGTKGVVFSGTQSSNVVAGNTIKGFATGVDYGSGSGNQNLLNTFLSNTANIINTTNIINMDSSGNVGIGTTSPASMFEVDASSNAAVNSVVRNYSNGATASSNLNIQNDSGSAMSLQMYGSGFTGVFNTYGSATFSQANWGRSRASTAASGMIVTTGGSTPIVFGTSDTERMRLLSGGQFGVGTSTPVADFQTTTPTANATTTVEFGKSGQSKGTCMKIYDSAGTAWYMTVSTGGTLQASASTCKSGF